MSIRVSERLGRQDELYRAIKETGNVLYGRRYRILVVDKTNLALDISQLRCTFNIVRNVLLEPNYSEVTVYNLNAQTENAIIKEGMRIIVEAGYEGEQYGVIFDGDVLQPIREKEDGTTYKLTITSIDGDKFMNFGLANFSLLRGQSMREVVNNVATNSTITTQLGSISEQINETKLTRGKVVFGKSRDVLRQIAQTNSAAFYMDNGKCCRICLFGSIIMLGSFPACDMQSISIYQSSPLVSPTYGI